MSWGKLNVLVPEPQCRTSLLPDGTFTITEWKDSRPQPTMAEIDAVPDSAVNAVNEQREEDVFVFDGVMATIAKGFHNQENRIRALEGREPVTLRQVIKDLRQL